MPEIFKIKNLHEIDSEAEVGLQDFEEIIDENRGFGDCNDQMVGSYWNKGQEGQFDKSFTPWVGMGVNSIEEGYHFYNRYAKETRKSTS